MVQKAKVKTTGIFTPSANSAPRAKAQADNTDLKGAIRPVGVGLTSGEKEALKAMAEAQGLTLNALMRFALRRFIVDVRAGRIDLEAEQAEPEPQKKRLKLPS